MAIAVVLKCSECSTIRQGALRPDEKEITCPACGRRMQNLTAEEIGEIAAVQKKQRLYCIISLVLFAVAATCLVLWIGQPGSGWVSSDKGLQPSEGLLAGAGACGLASIICGCIASMKRYVVEF
jgi:hypothetical protein